MMETKKGTNLKTFESLLWLAFGLLGFLAFREFLNTNILTYVSAENLLQSRRFLTFLIVSLGALAAWISYYFLVLKKNKALQIKFFKRIPLQFNKVISILIIPLPALIKWIVPLPENFSLDSWIMVFLFYSAALIAVWLRENRGSSQERLLSIGIFFMLGGVSYSILGKLNLVTGYPFTTYWSEGNRFFDYSVLLGSYRYITKAGEPINAFINWGMQLPWAAPFIFSQLSIGGFRLWNQLVWIIPTLLLGFVAIKKNKDNFKTLIAFLFACWTYLFLDQGPIYAPLVIAAILTVVAVRLPLTPGAVLVLLASYYVRSARWTWGYAPGIWAGLLSLLVISKPSFKKDKLKELVKPIILGIAGYIGGQLLPSIIRVLTKDAQLKLLPTPAASTTRQPLLWNRLFPNPTYPPGIILGLIWATLPIFILLLFLTIKKHWKINWMQSFSILAVVGAFLVVGIIASTKIGGGSNLHNLDMFLVTLVLTIAAAANYLMLDKIETSFLNPVLACLILAALVTPVTYSLQNSERLELPPPEKTNEAMLAVQNKVKEFSSQGEILFIDHRQLLTFGLVQNVPLVDEYEKKYLMDSAMAEKEKYFQTFYEDIARHRFVLIVNEPTNLVSRGTGYSFGEENDAYVKWVSAPLLCQYEPLYTSPETALELLVPRTSSPPQSIPCEDIFAFLDE